MFIQKILFPVDFSPSSTAMALYVKRVADLFGAEVTLVHVCDLASHSGFELYVRTPQEIAETHTSVAQDDLQSFLLSDFPRSPRVLRSGDAASQIAEVAKAGDSTSSSCRRMLGDSGECCLVPPPPRCSTTLPVRS